LDQLLSSFVLLREVDLELVHNLLKKKGSRGRFFRTILEFRHLQLRAVEKEFIHLLNAELLVQNQNPEFLILREEFVLVAH
jgi:hypothetical protein